MQPSGSVFGSDNLGVCHASWWLSRHRSCRNGMQLAWHVQVVYISLATVSVCSQSKNGHAHSHMCGLPPLLCVDFDPAAPAHAFDSTLLLSLCLSCAPHVMMMCVETQAVFFRDPLERFLSAYASKCLPNRDRVSSHGMPNATCTCTRLCSIRSAGRLACSSLRLRQQLMIT